MMTPEEIKYINEWARSGNELRSLSWESVRNLTGLLTVGPVGPDGANARLNSAGLAIAALADALEQANETAEDLCDGYVPKSTHQDLETMRANKRRLLG